MASKAIKGITIKLEGDSGELTKAMTEADRAIKSVENQLKAVNKALKLDPSNTQLLKQKQELLNQEIEQTKKKLEAEQQAAELAAQALEEGAMTKEEYDALQTEILETETKLKQLEQAAKDFGSATGQALKATGEKVAAVGDKMQEVGKSLTKNVTAPIVGLATASVAAFAEVDAGYDIIAARTGATGEALEDLKQIMNEIATEIPTDFNTAGEAVGAVNTRFGLTGQALKVLSGQFIKFAQLNNIDVTSAINSTQSAMAAFEVDTSQAGEVLDLFNTIGQQTGIDMNTLSSLIANNAATFKDMGFSMADAAYFLGQVELSGTDTTAVMSGLRRALNDAAAQGIPLSQALTDLQEDLAGATEGSEAMNLAIDLFGTKAGPAMVNMIQSGQVSFEAFGASLDEFAGNIDSTFGETVDGVDEMQMAMNSVKESGAALGEDIAERLAPALLSLADAIDKAAEWWESLDDSQQDAILGAVAVVAALGPVITILGSLVSGVGSAITSLGVLTTMFGGTGGAGVALGEVITGTMIPGLTALALPFLAIIAVIGAVIAVIMAVKKVMETSDAWLWAFGLLWDRLTYSVQNCWNAFTDFAANIGAKVQEIVNTVTEYFSGLISSALTWGSDMIDNFISGISAGVGAVADAAAGIAETVSSYLHFSTPDRGPLADADTYMPDMMDLFTEGIESNREPLQRAVNDVAGDIAGATDYSSQLDSINGNLANIGRTPINVTVVNKMGGKTFNRAVATATAENNYTAGGR